MVGKAKSGKEMAEHDALSEAIERVQDTWTEHWDDDAESCLEKCLVAHLSELPKAPDIYISKIERQDRNKGGKGFQKFELELGEKHIENLRNNARKHVFMRQVPNPHHDCPDSKLYTKNHGYYLQRDPPCSTIDAVADPRLVMAILWRYSPWKLTRDCLITQKPLSEFDDLRKAVKESGCKYTAVRFLKDGKHFAFQQVGRQGKGKEGKNEELDGFACGGRNPKTYDQPWMYFQPMVWPQLWMTPQGPNIFNGYCQAQSDLSVSMQRAEEVVLVIQCPEPEEPQQEYKCKPVWDGPGGFAQRLKKFLADNPEYDKGNEDLKKSFTYQKENKAMWFNEDSWEVALEYFRAHDTKGTEVAVTLKVSRSQARQMAEPAQSFEAAASWCQFQSGGHNKIKAPSEPMYVLQRENVEGKEPKHSDAPAQET